MNNENPDRCPTCGSPDSSERWLVKIQQVQGDKPLFTRYCQDSFHDTSHEKTVENEAFYKWFRQSGIVCVGSWEMDEMWEAWQASRQSAETEIEAYRNALTPSEETKRRHIGEYSVSIPEMDDEGNQHIRNINIPWTAVKRIMKSIMEHAEAMNQGEKG